MIYWTLFYTFFKIGLFTFGGGYAMIPMIQDEILGHGWMTLEQFVDFIAVSESTPGPVAVNMATFVGNHQVGILGGAIATLGVILPSFLILLLIAKFFQNFQDNFYVRAALSGLRPAVIGLITTAALTIGLSTLLPSWELSAVNWRGILMLPVLLYLSRKKKLHPIPLILLSAALGILLFGYQDLLALVTGNP